MFGSFASSWKQCGMRKGGINEGKEIVWSSRLVSYQNETRRPTGKGAGSACCQTRLGPLAKKRLKRYFDVFVGAAILYTVFFL